MDKSELGAASALAGAAIFSIHGMYAQHAGSLADCRNATPGDAVIATKLKDADILTGSLVLVVGGMLTYITKSKAPLVLAISAFAVTSTYYHLVCNSESAGVLPNGA
jgi:hypothetical protein